MWDISEYIGGGSLKNSGFNRINSYSILAEFKGYKKLYVEGTDQHQATSFL